MRLGSILLVALCLCMSACTESKKKDEAPSPASGRIPERAPDQFKARFETSKGVFVIEVTRDWAPRGADRFHQLVAGGYYNEGRFFRVLRGFVVQWGLNKDPKMNELWRQMQIPDDPVKQSNLRGFVSFASRGPASRTTQVFVNLGDNSRQLDSTGFAPFGKVIEGMEVLGSLYAGYGEGAPGGEGPDQSKIQMLGNEYLLRQFPRLDYIQKTAAEN